MVSHRSETFGDRVKRNNFGCVLNELCVISSKKWLAKVIGVVLVLVLSGCVSGQKGHNSTASDYKIHYDEARATIRTHPIGRPYPATLIDLAEKQFVYINGNSCYLGRIRRPRLNRIRNTDPTRTNQNIKKILRRVLGKPTTFYAKEKLSKRQVHERLRPNLRNECENRDVWLLSKTKPKLPTFEQYLKSYERNRTRAFAGSQPLLERRGSRQRRNVDKFYVRRRRNRASSPSHFKKRRYRKHRRNPSYQADDASSGKVIIADDVAYVSPSFNRNDKASSGFRHYRDFHNELESVKSNNVNNLSMNSHGSTTKKDSDTEQFSGSDSHLEMEDFKYPDTLVRDGQVFRKHDANEENRESKPVDEEKSDFSRTPQTNHGGTSFRGTQNGAVPNESTMPRGFDILMDHVRQVGAQSPIVSAAIAGASIRGSSEGSSSHVIGSAINGGYFAASAQGYDGRGGAIHSHVHGTAEGVSGGASAIAPDREGEAFIQVDHSERGHSVGQSSTHNGEAFVIADVDSQSEHQLQHGDSTSSYTDTYNTKRFGHTFGEARSRIASTKTRKEAPGNEQHGVGLKEELDKNDQRSVRINMVESIMEKVHHPDLHPTISSVADDNYFKEEYSANLDEYPSKHKIDEDGLLVGSGVAVREGEIQQVTLGMVPEGGNRSTKAKDKEGVVGLVTFPYGQVGTPPGPGELLNQVPETVSLPPLHLAKAEEEFYTDYSYESNISKQNKTNSKNNYLGKSNITFIFDPTIIPDNTLQSGIPNYEHHPYALDTKNTVGNNQFNITAPDQQPYLRKGKQPTFSDQFHITNYGLQPNNSYLLGAHQPAAETHFHVNKLDRSSQLTEAKHSSLNNQYDIKHFDQQPYGEEFIYSGVSNQLYNKNFQDHDISPDAKLPTEGNVFHFKNFDHPSLSPDGRDSSDNQFEGNNIYQESFDKHIFHHQPSSPAVTQPSLDDRFDSNSYNRHPYSSGITQPPVDDRYNGDSFDRQPYSPGVRQPPVDDQFDISSYDRQPYSPGVTQPPVDDRYDINSYDRHSYSSGVTERPVDDRYDSDSFDRQPYSPPVDDRYDINSYDRHLYSSGVTERPVDDRYDSDSFDRQPYSPPVDDRFDISSYDRHLYSSGVTEPPVDDRYDSDSFDRQPYSPGVTQPPVDDRYDINSYDRHPYSSGVTERPVDDRYDSDSFDRQPYSPPVDDRFDISSYDRHLYSSGVTEPPVDDRYDSDSFDRQPYSPDKIDDRVDISSYDRQLYSSGVTQPSVVSHFDNDSFDRKLYSPKSTQPPAETHFNINKTEENLFPKTSVLPGNEGRQTKIIPPGRIGSTQVLEPAGPGQPFVNVVTIDSSDKRKPIYQREGTPFGPGEKIPGIPGYRVPPGFRGRVVYDQSLPVKASSRKVVQGYNTHVRVQPQNSLEAASHLAPGHIPGVHITGNIRRTSSNTGRGTQSLVKHSPPRGQDSRKPTSNSWSRKSSQKKQNQYNTNAKTSRSWRSEWRSKKTQYNHRSPNSRFSDDSCEHYSYNCQTLYGPNYNSQICTPQLIAVACCC